VILDEDLADLYGVETRVLVQQVRRNEKRFPPDFMFQLSAQEWRPWRPSQVSAGHRAGDSDPLRCAEKSQSHRREHQDHAGFRRASPGGSSYATLEKRLEEIERELSGHDEQLDEIFMALRQLISPVPYG